MIKNPPGVVIYHECLDQISSLSMEERGELFTAILEYAKGIEGGVIGRLSTNAKLAFSFIRPRIDADNERYRNRCRTNGTRFPKYDTRPDGDTKPSLNMEDFFEN